MSDPTAPWLDSALLTVYSPASRPVSFLALEVVTLVCGALGFAHSIRAHRRGDAHALIAWTSVFVYGVALEILSYNAFPSFVHGQFTVMLYHRKLPLYVTAVYPVLIYTAMRAVRRLGLSRAAEPLVVGAAIVAMDFPFDVVGPDAGFWAWDALDPNVRARWHGVPVTSYYWHLTWGAILAFLCRMASERLDVHAPGKLLRRLAWAIPIAGVTMGLGRVAFLPFDALTPLGVPHGAIVLGAFALALATFVLAAKDPEAGLRPDRTLVAIPCLFFGVHVLLATAILRAGRVTDAGGKWVVIGLAVLFAVVVHGASAGVIRLWGPQSLRVRRHVGAS